MSCQPPPWSRRNVSPKQQQRPVRATLPVSLMRQQNQSGSPTKQNSQKNESPPDLATKSYDLEKSRASVEEIPTLFLGPRGEKSKTLNIRSQPQQHHIRRTSSLDALFLTSQWQPDTIFLGHFMVDKATQTPEEWNNTELKRAQWKAMAAAGEQLEVKYIRQKLHRTNQSNRASGVLLCSQRQSPIQGDHSAISSLGSNSAFHSGAFGVTNKGTHTPIHPSVAHITRPIPITRDVKLSTPRLQSSLEGLNQEIEKLVLRNSPDLDRGAIRRVLELPPEGHRAPIAELFHSIEKQPGHESSTSSETASRSHSISPAIPIIPECSISPSSDDTGSPYKFGSSPHINEFLTRDPPDGCEKVKIIEEPRRRTVMDYSSGICWSKPEVTYVLLPSQSSAFCPLHKELKPATNLYETHNVLSQAQTQTSQCHK